MISFVIITYVKVHDILAAMFTTVALQKLDMQTICEKCARAQ